MSYYRYSCMLALSLSMTGCAITSGLQTYDLPKEGTFQTDLGSTVNVIKLTQENLVAVQPAQVNQQNFAHLFNQQQQSYRLNPVIFYLFIYGHILKLHHPQIQ